MAEPSDPLSQLFSRLKEIVQSPAPAAERMRQLVSFSWELIDWWKNTDETSHARLRLKRASTDQLNSTLRQELDKSLKGALTKFDEAQRQLAERRDGSIDALNRLAGLNSGYWGALHFIIILFVLASIVLAIGAIQKGFAYGFMAVSVLTTGLGLQLLKHLIISDRRLTISTSIAKVQAEWEADKKALNTAWAKKNKALEDASEIARQKNEDEFEKYKRYETDALQKQFIEGCRPLVQQVKYASSEIVTALGCAAAPWEEDIWSRSAISQVAHGGVRFGAFSVADNYGFAIDIPALMSFGKGKSLLFKVQSAEQSTEAIYAANAIIARILGSIASGKVQFTFIDPIGLGQNVAGFLALADYDPKLVTHQAWTEARQIEERLSDLTVHMATVLQKRLRQNYQDIDDYNSQAGVLNEPYRVVVVLNFPEQFNESSARQLQRIVQSGARCGVYAIVVANADKQGSHGVKLEDLEPHCDVVDANSSLRDPLVTGTPLRLDGPPPNALAAQIVDAVGQAAPQGVEIPFHKLMEISGISSDALWTGNSSDELKIPIGQYGDQKVQYLTFGGSGTAHHALVVGRPGSGKSNLMHVMITAAARHYSPNELLFYLVDFKKGVEFKAYAENMLPHAKVIAVESEREFGLSVLQGIDDEMKRRGDAFRKSGVASVTEFRKTTNQYCPRLLLLVDEFQEFFTQDDQIGREASLLLDRIVRQGRAFGIHVMLGSQTLAGSYSLAKSTLDQMAIRIALQCSEADSRLVLADDNPAARQLSRPGEGVYNASNGLEEGNNIFQVALLTNQERQAQLLLLREWARAKNTQQTPIIFEGHEPALLSNCAPLRDTATRSSSLTPQSKIATIWLGEPLAIRPPTSMQFRKQSGVNLLVVTRDESEASGVLFAAALSLAAQPIPANIIIIDLSIADADGDSPQATLAELLPQKIKASRYQKDLQGIVPELSETIAKRQNDRTVVNDQIFLVILGLHRARDLRPEDGGGLRIGALSKENTSPNLPKLFSTILRDGPEVGVHVLAWADSYASLGRILDRQSLREFGVRIVGAMNNQDSMHLIDSAAASKIDRPHRLIKADESVVGVLETFRPYELPSLEWLRNLVSSMPPP